MQAFHQMRIVEYTCRALYAAFYLYGELVGLPEDRWKEFTRIYSELQRLLEEAERRLKHG